MGNEINWDKLADPKDIIEIIDEFGFNESSENPMPIYSMASEIIKLRKDLFLSKRKFNNICNKLQERRVSESFDHEITLDLYQTLKNRLENDW